MTTAEPGALLDLDRDGRPDRVEGIWAPEASRGAFGLASLGTQLFLGQANGTQQIAVSGLEVVRDPIQRIEDINEDGCLDVGFDPTRYRQNPYWYLQDRSAAGACLARFHAVSRRSSELPYFPGFARYSIDVDNSGTLDKVVLVSAAYGDNEGFPSGGHVFLKQANGSYAEAADPGLDLAEIYYQMLQPGDWNNDGLVDLAGQGALRQASSDGGIALYTNQTVTTNAWLKVRLPTVMGPIAEPGLIEVFQSGRMGDQTALVSPAQPVRAGRHWPSLVYHFGVGAATSVDVRVLFPDGSSIVQPGVSVRQTLVVSPTPNAAPEARAVATPSSPEIGTAARFDGTTSFDSDGVVVSWIWDYGDGSGASGAIVSHAYAAVGNYIARLAITDDRGATASVSLPISVGDSVRPSVVLAQATFLPQVADNVGVTVVQWFVDGSLRSTAGVAPFAFTLDLGALSVGRHLIGARAFDAVGNSADAANFTIEK